MFAQRSFGYVATLILISAFLFCILLYCYIVTFFTWRISLACWGRRSLCSKLLASYRLSLVLGNLYLEWQFKKKNFKSMFICSFRGVALGIHLSEWDAPICIMAVKQCSWEHWAWVQSGTPWNTVLQMCILPVPLYPFASKHILIPFLALAIKEKLLCLSNPS